MPSNHLDLLFSCLQSFPASGSFPMSQFFSSGQSIGASASASVLPVNIQGWFPLGLTGWIKFLNCIEATMICLGENSNINYTEVFLGASLVAQKLKHLPARIETRVWSLGWEGPLEKEMATHSSILAWRIPSTEEPGRLQSTGSAKSRIWLSKNQSINRSVSEFDFHLILNTEKVFLGLRGKWI